MCVVEHPQIMERLKLIALRLTYGTELHEQHRRVHSHDACGSHMMQCPSTQQTDITFQEELEVKRAFLQLIVGIAQSGDEPCSERFFQWDDGLTLVVLLRQCLMEDWGVLRRNVVDAPPTTADVVGDTSPTTTDSNPTTGETDTTKLTMDHSELPAACLGSSPRFAIDQCRIEALNLLSLLSKQSLWSEDQQSLFATFLEWVNDVRVNGLKQSEEEMLLEIHNVESYMTFHKVYVLKSLASYLWSVLIRHADGENDVAKSKDEQTNFTDFAVS